MTYNQKYRLSSPPLPLALLLMACAFNSVAAGNNGVGVPQTNNSRVQQGFAIAPVKLNLKGKNRALVGLGSYLVNGANGCNDCHTHPSYAIGGDPYLGQPELINAAEYLAGGREFGPFTSHNITPDANGLPAGLSLKEFITVMRTGQDPEMPGTLLQVMPWPIYSKMTTHDLSAIYEYLRAIPSLVDNPNPGP
jgi:hypothetical protein